MQPAASSSSTSLDLTALHEQHVALARQHAVTACEYFLRDESSGLPVKLQPFQEHWHRLIDRHPRLVLHSFVESGKTSALTVGRVICELGKNPNLRCAIVSNTGGQASRILLTVAKYIEHSAELRELFPGLVPDQPWHSSALYVKRQVVSKDPSVQAVGVHGNVLGARLDLLILDDVLDYENTRTPELRRDLHGWYNSTLASRLTRDARVLVVGSAWHPADLMHEMSRSPAWRHHLTPAVNDDGSSMWPARWPLDRIARRKEELGAFEFARQMLCRPRSDEDARFQKAWIDAALERGRGTTPVVQIFGMPAGWRTYCGVDLAFTTAKNSDRTALAAIAVGPDGARQLLCIESGKWLADETVRRILNFAGRYKPSSFVVETVGGQQMLADMLRKLSSVPITDFKTGGGRMSLHHQAERLAVELSNGKHQWPSGEGRLDPEIAALVDDVLYYSPQAHVGDRLAALLFALHGAHRGSERVESARLDWLTRR